MMKASPHSGALAVDKPVGFTSSDVVVRLKKALTIHGYFEKGFRIGHGGTLDPFATGVLVVLLGEATKLADCYLHSKKIYTGIIQLGVQTDTGDHTGTAVQTAATPPSLTSQQWNDLAQKFVNEPYLQVPPMYSAKKIDGQALHHLARQGIEVERAAILKKIFLFNVKLISDTELSFEISCESGTYVRVIAEDLAKLGGTLAHLTKLVRARSSDVELEACLGLEAIEAELSHKKELTSVACFRKLSSVATHLKEFLVNEDSACLIRTGAIALNQEISEKCTLLYPQDRYVLVKTNAGPVALLEKGSDSLRFRIQRVFNPIS